MTDCRHLLYEPRQTHEQRQRHDPAVEQVKPCWRELRIVHEIGRVIDAKPVDHVAREGSKGMIQPHHLARSPEATESFDNQLLAQLRHHGFEFCHARPGEIRVERLSPLAVEIMLNRCEMGSLEVDDSIDESLVSVRGADGARDVELIVVIRVAEGQLVRVDPYNRPYNV